MKAPLTAKRAMEKSVTEDELLTAIIEAATFLGWKVHHIRRSDKAIQMGHAGFPDLVLAKRGRLLLLELKREGGALTQDQLAWMLEMPPASRAVTFSVVYPSDLDTVLGWLA